MASFRIEGGAALAAKLNALPGQVRRVALVKAVKAAAAPVQTAAQSRAPHGATGALARSIQTKFVRRGTNRVGVQVGVFASGKYSAAQMRRYVTKHGHPPGPPRKAQNDPYYAPWVEYGHDLVKRVRSGVIGEKRLHVKGGGRGAVIGHVQAHPFMRPAFDAAKTVAIEEMGKALGEELERLAATPA